MQSSDQEIARRALSAALDRLEGRQQSENSSSDAQANSPSNVFIIMLGSAPPENSINEKASAKSDISYNRPALNESADYGRSVEVHPSLQRFDLSLSESCSTAPRMCHLEPDRVCVNSGACQTLGH